MKSIIKNLGIALLCIGVLIGTGAPARANLITQTFDIGSPSSPVNLDVTQLFNVGFDAALGTLNSVNLSLSAGFTTESDFYNGSHVTDPTAYLTSELKVGVISGPGVLVALPIDKTVTTNFSIAAGGDVYQSVSTNLTYSHTYTSNLSEFEGGTNAVPITLGLTTTFSGGGNEIHEYVGSDAKTGDLTMTLTYNYTPIAVPEPSSGLLFGMGGLVSLGWAWRRKVAHKA